MWEMLALLLLPSATDAGIHSAAQPEAAERLAHNRNLDPGLTAAGKLPAGIAAADLLVRSEAFRVRAIKSGRILLPREMLFPGLNRYREFTTP